MRCQAWIVALLLLIFSRGTEADVPRQISHQGVLLDSSGVVVPSGLYSIDFDIYDAPSLGTQLFHQQLQVNVLDGVYNVLLSDNGTSTLTLEQTFQHPNTYLQLTIQGGPSGFPVPQALQPRQKLASVPYALSSAGGVVVATDSESPPNRIAFNNGTQVTTIASVAPSLTVPAEGGVIRASGRISLQQRAAGCNSADCTAKLSLQYTRNGGAATSCRSAEVQHHDRDDGEPAVWSVSIDCLITDSTADDVYVFTFGVIERGGDWYYGDANNSGGDDTIYIDAIWYPTR
jgi:hypothetical protein